MSVESTVARVAIDARLPKLQAAAETLASPRGGWISAIRVAFGMSAADLARRVGVNPSTVLRIEANEVAGTVNLETLSKMADALNCDLVYALVPKASIEVQVKRRALALATARFKRTQRTMALEQQGLQASVLQQLIENEAEKLARSQKLWKEKLQDE